MFSISKFAGVIALALAIVSGITIEPTVEAKEVKKEMKVNTTWTKQTTAKVDTLVKIGMPKEVAKSLVTHCKNKSRDPVHCIKIGASILGAESSLGTKCYKNNCVGMNDGGVSYKSVDEGIGAWVGKYNTWWYKQKSPSGFYSDTKGRIPPTRYCMGKKKDGVCKEGFKNSWNVFNKLAKL